MILAILVVVGMTPALAQPAPALPPTVDILESNDALPVAVARTRNRLIEAARTGDVERLVVVFQMNETMPVYSRDHDPDPATYWRSASGDGNGFEILAILLNILELPPAHVASGRPQEMFVWPYLAKSPLDELTPAQLVDLHRLMTAQDANDLKTLKSWGFWHLGIGPDGTLHFFLAHE